ncbi:MAG: MurT ligase domain-containing protein, partial [Acidobacteriota bacterium]
MVEKLAPGYLRKTARKLRGGSIVITGTNGKTTTAKMLRAILEANGQRVVANRAGSNMTRGIVSTLLEHSKLSGRLKGDVGLFEVDEAFVPEVARQLQPRAIVVLNLQRDQLDRYVELDRTAHLIGSGLQYAKQVVLNADDPLVVDLAKYAPEAQLHYFGATPRLQNLLPDDANLFTERGPGRRHLTVPREKLEAQLKRAETQDDGQLLELVSHGQLLSCQLPLDGIYNAYNAAAAQATATSLGVKPVVAAAALEKVKPAFGRTELVEVDGKRLQILLVKNPAGFNQVIKTFLSRHRGQSVLMAINDNIADGRDVSWLWDVDFEKLRSQQHHILSSG